MPVEYKPKQTDGTKVAEPTPMDPIFLALLSGVTAQKGIAWWGRGTTQANVDTRIGEMVEAATKIRISLDKAAQ